MKHREQKYNSFKILSIDGGGLRGIVPILILIEIEKITGKKIHEIFDLIVGTSTGGIITCGLAATKDGINNVLTLEDMLMLYTKHATDIFPRKNKIQKLINSISSLFNPKYSEKGLEKLLDKYFSDMDMNKNLLKPICVTSYDIKNNEVVIFKSRKSKINDKNKLLKLVCRATSAAPTYFKPLTCYWDGKKRELIDGGIYLNNPSMVGITDAIKNRYGRKVKLNDIKLLSLGTGSYSEKLGKKSNTNWGIIKWIKPISEIMMQASSLSVNYQTELLINDYLRLQLILDKKEHSSMDDSSKETIDYIIDQTKKQILENKDLMVDLNVFLKNL